MTCRIYKATTDCCSKGEGIARRFGGNWELLFKHSPGENVKLYEPEVAMELSNLGKSPVINTRNTFYCYWHAVCPRTDRRLFPDTVERRAATASLRTVFCRLISTKRTQGWNSTEKLKDSCYRTKLPWAISLNTFSWYTVIYGTSTILFVFVGYQREGKQELTKQHQQLQDISGNIFCKMDILSSLFGFLLALCLTLKVHSEEGKLVLPACILQSHVFMSSLWNLLSVNSPLTIQHLTNHTNISSPILWLC